MAMMKIKLRRRHINKGRRGCADCCPVTLALEEATGAIWDVGNDVASKIDSVGSFLIPKRVLAWIKRFDAGADRNEMNEMTFTMDVGNLT